MNLNEILAWSFFCFFILILLSIYVANLKSYQIVDPKYRRAPVTITPEDFKLAYEKIFFNSSDSVELSGWYVPATNGDSEKTIIICHGWGSNKGEILKDTYFLAEHGFNLFYFDFRGSGESKTSKFVSLGYFEIRDLEGAIKFLENFKSEEAKNIYLYGCSMGGAVVLYAAAHNPKVKAVLAESVFLSFKSVIKNWSWHRLKVPYFPMVMMTSFFVKMKLKVDPELYSPLGNLDKIHIPVLFIHGENDDLVSELEADTIFRLCASDKKEKWRVKNASHAKCPEVAGEYFKDKVLSFYNSVK